VGGTLTIGDNSSLASLDGLDITSVSQDVNICWNDALPKLDVPDLTTVGSTLHIWDNDSLSSLSGLSGLATVGDNLMINSHVCLSQAEAETFAAGVDVSGGVDVFDNGADYPCDGQPVRPPDAPDILPAGGD